MKWKSLVVVLVVITIQIVKSEEDSQSKDDIEKDVSADGGLSVIFAPIVPSVVSQSEPITMIVGLSPPVTQKPIESANPSHHETATKPPNASEAAPPKPTVAETHSPKPSEPPKPSSPEPPRPSSSEPPKPTTEPPKPTSTTPPPAPAPAASTHTVTVTVTVTSTITATISVAAASQATLPSSTAVKPTSEPPSSSATKTQATNVFWALPMPHPTYGDINWVAHLSKPSKSSEPTPSLTNNPQSTSKIPAPLILEKINATNPSYIRLNRRPRNHPVRKHS